MEPRLADPHHGTGLVGRDPELGELLAALGEAAGGSGRLVLLGGEPGIGKSRLADELASRARERDYAVLWGRRWEDAGAPPYWPWVQALRTYLRSTAADSILDQLGAGVTDVAQMLPELRSLQPGLELPVEAQSDSARFQLFDSTTTFLRNAAAVQPILIVIDDLQAADTPSVLYLQFLASQLSEMRLLVVATYRDVALDHALSRAIGELTREPTTRSYLLQGLDPGAVGQFIGAATGVVPSHRAVAAVQRGTKGNPLFVIEAVRLLTAEGRINDVADLPSLRIAVPAGIREVIARRIGHLGEGVEETLALGAAIGPEFSVELLRRVGANAGNELMNQLDGAAEAGLIAPMTAGTARYRFSHDLIRKTLYERLSPGRRAGVHRRIAEVLEDMTDGAADAYLAELAFHYYQAAQAPEGGPDEIAALAQRAMEYARRAADQASWSLAFEEAARLRRMALAMLAASPETDDVLHGEILLSLGDAQARAGDLEGSKASFREAADIARRTGTVSQLASAAIGYGGRLPWTRPGRDAYIIPLLQDALVLLGGTDDRLRVRLLARLASAWRSSPEHFPQSATLSQQALELARGLDDDPSTLSYALAGRYWSTWWPENPDERRAIAEEMEAVAESSGDAERLIDAQLMLYMACTETSQMEEARRAEEEVHRLANELRQPSQLWLGVAPRGLLALFDGDLDAAERYVARELTWGDPITNVRDERSAGIMHLFLLRREQGRLAEAEPLVRAAVEEFPWYPVHRAALAQVLTTEGREAEARSVFQSLAADDFAALYRDNEWLLGMALASEACAQLRDTAAAAVLYGQLAPFSGRHAIGHAEGSAGAVDRYLGLLAGTQLQLDVAVRHLTDATRLNQSMGARPMTAHSQHELAEVLRLRNGVGDLERLPRSTPPHSTLREHSA